MNETRGLWRGKRLVYHNYETAENVCKWVYGYYYHQKPKCGAVGQQFTKYDQECDCIIAKSGKRFEIIPSTLGECVGLRDKNGKLIFEGDILPVYEDGEEYLYKVIYEGDCFMLAMLDSEQGSYPISRFNQDMREVIGNIHDNPELLNGKKEGK